VVSSGRLRSAVEFFEVGFAYLGMDRNLKDCLIEKNESHRPLDHQGQVGDAKKLKALTKWGPKVEFEKMISIMIDSELKERMIKN